MIDISLRSPLATFGSDYNSPGIYKINHGDNLFNFLIFAENKDYSKLYSLTVTRKDNIIGMQDINSPVAERIYIYSVTGRLLYSFDKPVGRAGKPRPYTGTDCKGQLRMVAQNSD